MRGPERTTICGARKEFLREVSLGRALWLGNGGMKEIVLRCDRRGKNMVRYEAEQKSDG